MFQLAIRGESLVVNQMKPMLAATCYVVSELKFPMLATRKIDGIRCLISSDNVALSRSLVPIPNAFIQEWVKSVGCLAGLDGELCVNNSFAESSSQIMSVSGEPNFTFYVFDKFDCDRSMGYEQRVALAKKQACGVGRIVFLDPIALNKKADMFAMLDEVIVEGYEGLMLRRPGSPYKFGRSTIIEQHLVKIKPFEDSEAIVTGISEEVSESGEPKGRLGRITAESPEFGKITIGSGFNADFRNDAWANPSSIIGSIVSFRFQRIGTRSKPRCLTFRGIRSSLDV